ncbi:MAG: DUF3486 family protein [Panacagrimonas sp.]
MAPRSAVSLLPEPIRAELNQRLLDGSFSDYQGLEAWMESKGFKIGKSSLHRYGKKFEDRIGALRLVTEQARAVVAESPDDDNSVNAALIRLAQEKAFNVLMELELDPETIEFPKLMRAIADMGRASLQQVKFAAEARKALATEVEEKLKSGPRKLDAETYEFIRRAIRGEG